MGEAAPEGQGRTEGVGLEQMGRGWPRGAGMDRGGGVGPEEQGWTEGAGLEQMGKGWPREEGMD